MLRVPVAYAIAPTVRKRVVLANACMSMWSTAPWYAMDAPSAPMPSPRNMYAELGDRRVRKQALEIVLEEVEIERREHRDERADREQ